MEKYKFNLETNQSIVNGVMQGYKNYLEERKIKYNEMHISSAYAWVKGNHIDDQTAVECMELGINYTKAKAGYTWGYLQFNVNNRKSMFIIKNAKYFDEENFMRDKGIRNDRGKIDADN